MPFCHRLPSVKKTPTPAPCIPTLHSDVLKRLTIIAKLHGEDVVDWPRVKRLMQLHLPPSHRVLFSARLSNKRVPYPNDLEKMLIAHWESVTGVSVVYPADKMYDPAVPILQRGQSIHGIRQHQEAKKNP